MLSLFVDWSLKPAGAAPTSLLFPHWPEGSDTPPLADDRYTQWLKLGRELYRLEGDRKAASLAALQYDLTAFMADPQAMRSLRASLERNRSAGLLTWVFYWNDDDRPIDLPGARIFRTGGSRHTRLRHEEGMPSFCEALTDKYFGGELPPLQIEPRPRVAFCGNAMVAEKAVTRLVGWFRGQPGMRARRLRTKIMEGLAQDANVDTSFHSFETFFVGASEISDAERLHRRKLFVENLAGSSYALAVRGTGNYSYRLYEAMSLGRIPVLIDTACPLPLMDKIDWPEISVWIPEGKGTEVAGRLQARHLSLGQDGASRLSHVIYRTWRDFLTPEGFYRTILGDRTRQVLAAVQ